MNAVGVGQILPKKKTQQQNPCTYVPITYTVLLSRWMTQITPLDN